MILNILIAMLTLSIVLPVGIFYLGERKTHRFKNLLAINIVSFFSMLTISAIFIFSGNTVASTLSANDTVVSAQSGLKFVGAALSTGLAAVGAGIATGSAASAALGALSENEGIMGKALIFVALAEGIAIYGLIISIMILNS